MYPNFRAVATTLPQRENRHAERLGGDRLRRRAVLRGAPAREPGNLRPRRRRRQFRLGLIYALLAGKTPQEAVEYGAAHGALAMTTPGDTSMATLKEVEAVMKGKGARVIR